MKIYYITQAGLNKAAADTVHSLEIINAFVAIGHNVTVINMGPKHNFTNVHINSIALNIKDTIFGKLFFQVWLLYVFLFVGNDTLHERCDIIYVRQSAVMFAPSIISRFKKVPLFSEFNTIFSHPETTGGRPLIEYLLRFIEAYTIKTSTRLIVVSENLKHFFVENYSESASKVVVAENGANIEIMKPLDQKAARHMFGFPGDAYIVGFVGHLHPWQGIDCLIEACTGSFDKYPDLMLVIAGSGRDRCKYEALVRERGLRDAKVIFMGGIPYEKVPYVIASFDVCVAPGCRDDMFNYAIRSPLKIYEYLACGKPVIAGYLDALKKYFHNYNIGLLITPGDLNQLRSSIEYLYANKEVARTMGFNGRTLAESCFSWVNTARKIIDA